MGERPFSREMAKHLPIDGEVGHEFFILLMLWTQLFWFSSVEVEHLSKLKRLPQMALFTLEIQKLVGVVINVQKHKETWPGSSQ